MIDDPIPSRGLPPLTAREAFACIACAFVLLPVTWVVVVIFLM